MGLLGVTHANSALEAIQRLIGKVELGLVSQVLDTILHVESGAIQQVLELRMTVKPPTGMQEELARPVIEVVEFPSGKLTHEMFAFGSEIAVVPVEGRVNNGTSPLQAMAKQTVVDTVRQWVGVECEVVFSGASSATIYAPSNMVATLVGKGGENVRQLQDELGGLRLTIDAFENLPEGMERPNRFWYDDRRQQNKGGSSKRRNKQRNRR